MSLAEGGKSKHRRPFKRRAGADGKRAASPDAVGEDEEEEACMSGALSPQSAELLGCEFVANPLFRVLATRLYHRCALESTGGGVEVVSFELPAGWERTTKGERVLCTAQLYDATAQSYEGAAPRRPIPWRHPTQLSLLTRAVAPGWYHIPAPLFHTERRAIATPLPRRRRLGMPAPPAPALRNPVVLRDVRAGVNRLEVKTLGERAAVVVQCVIERSAAEVAEQFLLSQRKNCDWGRAILDKEVGGGSDADVLVTDIPISLKCPYSFQRIMYPARGAHCAHFGCFDLTMVSPG